MDEISNTTAYNNLLRALDSGKVVYVYNSTYGTYRPLKEFTVGNSNGDFYIFITDTNNNTYSIFPSDGYSSSDLYTPTNFIFFEGDPFS